MKARTQVLILMLQVLGFLPSLGEAARPPKELMQGLKAVNSEESLLHAKELLGRTKARKIKTTFDDGAPAEVLVHAVLKENLPKKDLEIARPLANEIIVQSKRYDMDPFFVLAVIATESSFNGHMVGLVGERGLMQIRPETAQYIAKKEGLEYLGAHSLAQPITNIRIGTAYLNYLREKFDGSPNRYISAYNMGPTKVVQLYRQAKKPSQYTQKVMRHYIAFYEYARRSQANVAQAD